MYKSNSNEHFQYVGSMSELLKTGRVNTKVKGRNIFVLHHQGTVFAVDSLCYHAGGPLYQGDIEDFGGIPCVVCPWHKYKISLKTGEGLYYAIDPHNLQKPPKLKSKGRKQRVHEVKVNGDYIYVAVQATSTSENCSLESDYYNNPCEEQ